MRFLLRFVGALLALALVVLGVLWYRLDFIAQRMIERSATERLGVETDVQLLWLRPFSGILSLTELRIANPPGWDGPFLRVDEARGTVDVATIRSPVIEVKDIELSGVELNLEERPGGSNYDAIVRNLHARAQPPSAEPGPSVRVHDLYVRRITAHVRLGPAPPLTLEIPELHLHDLGGPGGATTGEITAVVVRDLLTAVATQAPGMPFALAGKILGGLGLGAAADVLKGAGERGLDALRGLLHEAVPQHSNETQP